MKNLQSSRRSKPSGATVVQNIIIVTIVAIAMAIALGAFEKSESKDLKRYQEKLSGPVISG